MGYELNPFTKKLDKVGAVGGGGTTNITGVITITPGGNTAGVTNAISSGSVMLAGGNNITLSQNGSTISFSGPNTVAQTQFVLSNSNGVSFGTNGSTVTATVRTDYQSAGAYLTTAMQSASSSVFAKTGFTTASTAGTDIVGTHDTNGLSMGVPKYLTTAQPIGAYLTTARASNDAIGLATAGTNVTLTANSAGLSINAGAYLTTAQPVGAYLTTARASNDAIGLNTALTGNGVAWTVNSSGLSLNVPAFLTTAAQSNHSHGNPTLALTNLSGTTASASNGLTLSLSAAAPGAGGGAALKGSGTYTQNTGTVEFANSNGITFGLSNNGTMTASHNGLTSQTVQTQNMVSVEGSTGNIDFANANGITFGFNASTITASHNGLTTARASNDAIGLNTAQSNVTWTANSAGLSLDARGYAGTGTTGTNATFTLNSNGLQLNAGAYLTTAMASNRGTDFVQANAAFAGTNASGTIASNGISVSVAAPGGGAAPTASASNGSFTFNTLGFSNANNVTFGTSAGSIITASVAAPGGGAAATGSYFDNMFQQNSVQAITFSSMSTGIFGRVIIQPLAPGNELFPFRITANTMMLNFSANATATAASSSHSSTMWMGIYTRVNSTQLSLLNSVSRSWGMTANTGNSASYHGARYLTVHSSQWSSQPVFEADSRYFFAVLFRSSNYSGSSGSSLANSIAGMHLGASVQRSGLLGSAGSSGTSYNAWHPFMGVHSLTTHTVMPVSIANADINKASAYANFIPQVIFDAGLGLMN